jgi:ubiquinone/menaquinone biosynthesis C-methylase UbiE
VEKDRIKEKITNYYHTHDEYYDKLETVFSDRADEAIKRGSFDIMEYAERADAILDVGCGTGALLRTIKKRYPDKQCFGVDLSPIAIKKAGEKADETGMKITFRVGDMENDCPFPSGSFDFIIAHEVMEHFVHPERVIRNIGNMLKENGTFLVIAPNTFIRASIAVKMKKIADFLKMIFDKDYLNLTVIDPPLDITGGDSDAVYVSNPWEIQRMVRNAGLTIVKKSNLKCRLVATKKS